MKPGDEVVTVGDLGGYYTDDPEGWGNQYECLVSKGSEAIIVGTHPTMPGWWVVRVLSALGVCWAPVEDRHVKEAAR